MEPPPSSTATEPHDTHASGSARHTSVPQAPPWRPYEEEPLVTPAWLGGWASCDPRSRERLTAYLTALIRTRESPVHTAVAFNAVYFGYDVNAGGYVGGPLDIGDFPSVALGDEIDALPVGAMINIRTGGDLLPAEIVYKEGAHGGVDPLGDAPGWISGAPSGAHGPGRHTAEDAPVLRERLVFDTTAFGQELAPTATRLLRLQRRGRTDPLGHLVVNARYPASEADLDDSAYYARFLVTRARAQLTSGLVPAPLPTLLARGHRDEDLAAGVHGLMDVVRHALRSLEPARTWGDYTFTRASMAERLASRGPLGRSDLDQIARSALRRTDRKERRRGAAHQPPLYTAVGAVLRSRPEWREEIRGTRYPLAVVHTNSALADVTRRESDEAGLLEGGIRLTLDDRWQSGGIWRTVSGAAAKAEAAADSGPAERPADEPLGRGWAESLPPPRRHDPGPAAPDQEPSGTRPPEGTHGAGFRRPDDSDLGRAIELSETATEVRWALPLRAAHLRGRCLPLFGTIAEELTRNRALSDRLRVVLDHAGRCHSDAQATHEVHLETEDQVRVVGIDWPPSFFPGIWITVSWPRGGSVLRARTVLLDEPVLIDGRLVEHRYDRRVVTRDGEPAHGPGLTSSHAVLLKAVRRLGLLDQYGQAMLARSDVPEAARAVLPGVPVDTGGVRAALAELVAAGTLTLTWGSRGPDGRTHHPPVPAEPAERLVCYWPPVLPVRADSGPDHPVSTSEALRGVREHTVGGFLRRIGHLGRQASDEQRALYREDHRRFRLTGPRELPPGFTYVRPHRRGH